MTEDLNTTDKPVIRSRFAPSPTGFLHIGGLRTALFAYLLAKKNNGTFILRIEDTDQARFVEGAIERMVKVLDAMGLHPDEGVLLKDEKIDNAGPYGPYQQSLRKEVYREYAMQLVAQGSAYYCFCDEKRLETLREEQVSQKLPPHYDRKCRHLSVEERDVYMQNKLPYVIRQAIPLEGQTVTKDVVYGDIVWDNKNLDDHVLLKSDGFPTYHLAVVVDDHLMLISHVIRGEEWLPSLPRHILLYKEFKWEAPAFAHLPILLNQDRSKLSKRQNDVSVEDYLKKGYLPEALINFVALLGWNPKTDQEFFTLSELAQQFDLAKVNKASPVFDVEKLDWFNGNYIRKLDLTTLTALVVPFLMEPGLVKLGDTPDKFITKSGVTVHRDFIEAVVKAEQERLKKLSEIGERVIYFFDRPSYEPELLIWRKANLPTTRASIEKMIDFVSGLVDEDFAPETLEAKTKDFISSHNLENGAVLWPLRVSLSGLAASPGPFEIANILHKGYGKEEIVTRLKIALEKLN
jgi:nondiscriminating glutamyl-tRNA synthetase